MRKNSVKNTRINGEVQKTLAEIIRSDIKDPRISPWTSVVAVEVAPDLKSCKAWISVLGGEEACEKTLEGLNSAMGYIRRQLAKTINLRNTPEITFVMDQSIAYGVNMSHRIDEVLSVDRAAAAERDGATEDPDGGFLAGEADEGEASEEDFAESDEESYEEKTVNNEKKQEE